VQDFRSVTRFDCFESVVFWAATADEPRWEGSLTDIGLGGARLVSPTPLEVGLRLLMVPREAPLVNPVCFEVRWCNEGDAESQVGLAVRETVAGLLGGWTADLWADTGLRPDQIAQRRKSRRVQLDLEASLGPGAADLQAAVILDLGLGGAALRSSLDLAEGSRVLIELPAAALTLSGRIVSRRSGQQGKLCYGVAFCELTSAHRAALADFLESQLDQRKV
jgi:c-di-GMP-binding flagellar brake protein YcgR